MTGDLLRLPDPAATLLWLDRYEECTPAFPAPHAYVRQRRLVDTAGGEVEAWVYLWNRATDGLAPLPANRWPMSGSLPDDDAPDT